MIKKKFKNIKKNKSFGKKNYHRKGFSLVELSIVILIIAILVVGVTQSSRLISITRLATAKQLTQSSPVSSIRGLIGWYEATSEKSFSIEDPDDNFRVQMWKDINPQEVLKNNLVSPDLDSSPIFRSNCINSLPCLEFNGTKFLNNTVNFGSANQLSIFAVFRINNLGSGIQSIISSKGLRVTENLAFTYGIDQAPIDKIYYASPKAESVSAFGAGKLVAKVDYLTYMIDDGFSVNQYVSDHFSTSSASVTGAKNISFFTVGAWDDGTYTQELINGYISELIIFNRALKIEERKEVEKYLTKKWKIKMFDPAMCGETCPYANYCPVSVIGSSTNFVAPGSGNVNCDQAGYTGSVSYNCQNGNSGASQSCSCATGYSQDGSYCKRGCQVSGVSGGTDISSVIAGTGSLNCIGQGFVGAASYICTSDGTFVLMTNCISSTP